MTDQRPTDHTASARPGWLRRHKAVMVLAVLALLLVAGVGGWSLYLNSLLQDIPRIDAGIAPAVGRDGGGSTTVGHGVNILIAGTDSRDPDALARLVRDGWTPGVMRSDTIMVVHLSADREHAYVVSIPRDTWTDVPGYGTQKVNAAFSYGGPALCVRTIEEFTGLRIDHLAVIDWTGFEGLSEAIGGVDVSIPRTVTNPSNGQVWQKGTVHLEGQRALDYVRQREGLANGDFDRINRQQNFLRAVMAKLLSTGTLNPVTLTNATRAIAGHLTLDSTFTDSEVRGLALSLRNLGANDVTFVTVPLKRYARIDGQSVNLVDRGQVRELFGAVLTDDLDGYLAQHGTAVLPAAADVP